VRDHLPDIENLHRFLGRGYYTCIDCDGYHTRGRKLLVMGNHINAVRLAMVMKRIYTPDVTLLLLMYEPPPDYIEELAEQDITLIKGRPSRIVGEEAIEALELRDGTRIPCEVVMQNFGYRLNDSYLKGLDLERDAAGFKYVVDETFQSSVAGLFIVGPLNTGNDQVVISAGAGATAAIAIKKKLLDL
jgi:thioredoxin reductase (NADPH)